MGIWHFEDGFIGTGGTDIVAHVPTRISGGAAQAGLSWTKTNYGAFHSNLALSGGAPGGAQITGFGTDLYLPQPAMDRGIISADVSVVSLVDQAGNTVFVALLMNGAADMVGFTLSSSTFPLSTAVFRAFSGGGVLFGPTVTGPTSVTDDVWRITASVVSIDVPGSTIHITGSLYRNGALLGSITTALAGASAGLMASLQPALQAGSGNGVAGIRIASVSWDNPSGTVLTGPTVPEGRQVTLEWQPVAGASGYHVYRDGVQLYTVSGIYLIDNYVSSPVNLGQTYTYYVRAFNSLGDEGTQSNTITVTPSANVTPPAPPAPPPPTPAAPTGLAWATGGICEDDQVSLAWTAAANALTYNVYRASRAAPYYALYAGGITTTSYVDTGAQTGQEYLYKVTAVNAAGESPYSDGVGVTPCCLCSTYTDARSVTCTGTWTDLRSPC